MSSPSSMRAKDFAGGTQRCRTRRLGPAALPEIVSGVRVGFSLTLLGVPILIGEMFASHAAWASC